MVVVRVSRVMRQLIDLRRMLTDQQDATINARDEITPTFETNILKINRFNK